MSSVGVKGASYPLDEQKRNAALQLKAGTTEIRRGLASDARQVSRRGMTTEEFDQRAKAAIEKIQRLTRELDEKVKMAEGVTP